MAKRRTFVGGGEKAVGGAAPRAFAPYDVEFVWGAEGGFGPVEPGEVAAAYAAMFSPEEARGPAGGAGRRWRVVFSGADDGTREVPGLYMADVGWQPAAAHIDGGDGAEPFVALGLLAWMYGRDPDVVRRQLESRWAPKGRRVVGVALRLFEAGWRLAPGRAPFRWGSSGPSERRAGVREENSASGSSVVPSPLVAAGNVSPMNCRAFAPALLGAATEKPPVSAAARDAVRRLLASLGVPNP